MIDDWLLLSGMVRLSALSLKLFTNRIKAVYTFYSATIFLGISHGMGLYLRQVSPENARQAMKVSIHPRQLIFDTHLTLIVEPDWQILLLY